MRYRRPPRVLYPAAPGRPGEVAASPGGAGLAARPHVERPAQARRLLLRDDRIAEGGIVASILVVIALWLVGPDHAATRDARSVALVSKVRAWRESGELPSVASPGDWH